MDLLKNIVSQFTTEGEVISAQPFGSGHINDSYLVITFPESAPDYVLQRINHHIFNNVHELTCNILKVTGHIGQKLLTMSPGLHGFEVIHLIGTTEGGFYFHDQDGNYWRMYNHVRGSRSYDKVISASLASEGGKAFGIFQHLTSDMDASTLFEVLPDFHNIAPRLAKFRELVTDDPAKRVNDAESEIAFIESRAEEMHTILRLGELGQIPVRVTHNDTKFNNILFTPDNKAVSVVDLDTVMPGYILYDFGDAIRTGASTAAEDEADLSRVNIDLTLFEAYAGGYLGIARNFLTAIEIDHLAFSAKFMTYIIGLRFLTDHLDGDHYYKTGFPGHNLQRARTQFRLLQSMEQHFDEMQMIIRKFK
ncbi:MAG: aminoglycoside phosphotransferase family protein [Bacteroidetes bacterium]|nr:aminoglycoside phosphotransferase family protein [Bacteroidota bacterium]